MSQGVILLPNGLPAGKARETLTKDEIKLVTQFEAWCRKRKLQFDLICETCADAGHGPNSRCKGDNDPDSTRYAITCAHAERVYGA